MIRLHKIAIALLVLMPLASVAAGLEAPVQRALQAPPPAPPSPPPPPPAPPTAPIYYQTPEPLAPLDPSKPQADPTPRVQRPPSYPEEEMCRQIGGVAILMLTYSKDGQVLDVQVEKSSGNRNLDRAAVGAARFWQLNPGIRNGERIAGKARVPVEFPSDHPPQEICNSPVRLSSVRLGRKVVAEGKDQFEFGSMFRPTDTLLLEVGYRSVTVDAAKSEMAVLWSYDDGSAPGTLLRDSTKTLPDGTNHVLFNTNEIKGWQPGDYYVQVFVDGRQRAKLRFRVNPAVLSVETILQFDGSPDSPVRKQQ